MCYLIAKKFGSVGSLALQTSHGQHLVDFKRKDKIHQEIMFKYIIAKKNGKSHFTKKEDFPDRK